MSDNVCPNDTVNPPKAADYLPSDRYDRFDSGSWCYLAQGREGGKKKKERFHHFTLLTHDLGPLLPC